MKSADLDYLDFLNPKNDKSQVSSTFNGSAYLDMACLNMLKVCYHSHQTCSNNLNAPSLKCAHAQIRFVSYTGGHDFHFWMNFFFEQNN